MSSLPKLITDPCAASELLSLGPPGHQKHLHIRHASSRALLQYKHLSKISLSSTSDHLPLPHHSTVQKSLPSSRLKQAVQFWIPSQDLISEYSLAQSRLSLQESYICVHSGVWAGQLGRMWFSHEALNPLRIWYNLVDLKVFWSIFRS